jgi:hypothetical protein
VYEYDSLTESQHLLTSGINPRDSYLMESSTSGDDVFVLTAEQLLRWDSDENYDVYDVRAEGGLPEPPIGVGACEGEACRSQSAPTPVAPATGTDSFTGPGNVRPHPCPKGRHRIHKGGKTRCVKHKAHRRHRAKRRDAATSGGGHR